MVDNLRFFAGAARYARGTRRRRVRQRLHVDDPPRADRRGRPDHAVELPADDGGLEDRPGARGRQHDRAEAGRDDAADDAEARRVRGRDPPRGRAQRDHRPRRPGRAGARHAPARSTWSRSPARSRPASGSPATRPTRSSASTSSSAARRRWSCSTTSTCQTALETIAGTGYYNAGQDCTAATRVLASAKVHDDVVAGLVEQANGAGARRHPLGGHDARAAELRAPARAGRGLPRATPGPRRDRDRRRASPIGPGSSSSRRSSPGCGRTTR